MSATPRFHRLTVQDVRRETADAVSIAFDVPGTLADDYRFTPGQYLTLRATVDGEDLRRSYSICSGPDDGELRIAVKRVEGGVFSDWVNRMLTPGDAIEVMTPTGRFGASGISEQPRIHVGFAAGSGITPVLSILRGVLAREPESRFFLFYGNRSTGEILFREALEELKDRFLGRLSVFHVLSQEEQALPVLSGRLDGDKARRLLRLVVPAEAVDEVYLCGPEGMSREIQAVLTELGVAPEKVHVELFVSALGGRPRPKPVAPAPDAPSRTAVLTVDGKRREVPVADGESILDAALRAGMDLPYACKGGMCSTCRARLVEGEAAMDLNYSLEPWELEAGFILTCQSHPRTDRVVVDYDQV
ncbi:1,2-phenylacetyl-CoA epoxidase subunit PaaE [Inquilinus sp. Marseille-Q2685]|uniref:1,2-phenylacetyl-CoA epoxidase subunit PaaE n=1 Tax=Inquilinus sp. Marseille-Q2685 TaxID=2866581 RepID=UPI001CE4AEAA|nr:1,2-phenylacetyl-CoA epoxidase subunit PaaE [Inquilinus sp. Marseille-Q2685]